ncbi:MAG: hypothetical protein K2X76_05190 [Sphingomonas sp.]|nr:hypothetical protein [Sphingomonas sp.]
MTDETKGFSLPAGSFDYDKLKEVTGKAAKNGDAAKMAAAIETARVPAHPEQPKDPAPGAETAKPEEKGK